MSNIIFRYKTSKHSSCADSLFCCCALVVCFIPSFVCYHPVLRVAGHSHLISSSSSSDGGAPSSGTPAALRAPHPTARSSAAPSPCRRSHSLHPLHPRSTPGHRQLSGAALVLYQYTLYHNRVTNNVLKSYSKY